MPYKKMLRTERRKGLHAMWVLNADLLAFVRPFQREPFSPRARRL